MTISTWNCFSSYSNSFYITAIILKLRRLLIIIFKIIFLFCSIKLILKYLYSCTIYLIIKNYNFTIHKIRKC